MASLFLDTSDNKKITIKIDSKTKALKSDSGFIRAEICLPLINELMTENRISLLDLKELRINTGPGSFTGLRVGASIANALGFLLKIPINGKKIGEGVFPVYN